MNLSDPKEGKGEDLVLSQMMPPEEWVTLLPLGRITYRALARHRAPVPVPVLHREYRQRLVLIRLLHRPMKVSSFTTFESYLVQMTHHSTWTGSVVTLYMYLNNRYCYTQARYRWWSATRIEIYAYIKSGTPMSNDAVPTLEARVMAIEAFSKVGSYDALDTFWAYWFTDSL